MTPPAPSIRLIADICSDYYGIGYRDMISDRRSVPMVHARHVAMYLARTLTFQSQPAIGRVFGRDHTTVLHAIRHVETMIAGDAEVAEEIETLQTAIRAAGIAAARVAASPEVPVLAVDQDPDVIARRVLDDPRGVTAIAVDELLALAAAVAAGPMQEVRAEPPPPAAPPVAIAPVVAAGAALLEALAALDEAAVFNGREAIVATRAEVASCRAALAKALGREATSSRHPKKENHDGRYAHA